MSKKKNETADLEESKISTFIRRLYRETCDISNKSIYFDTEGERLIIPDRATFVKETLNKISNTKDYSSFVRQLNNYGFTKIRNQDNVDADIYYHHNFQMGNKESLCFITRDNRKQAGYKENLETLKNSLQYLANSNYRQQKEINQLKGRVLEIERRNQTLYEILGFAFKKGFDTVHNKNIEDQLFISHKRNNQSKNLHLESVFNREKEVEEQKEEKSKNLFDEFYY